MSDINAYHTAISDATAKLAKQYPSGFLFITSIQNATKGSTAGAVTEVSTGVGAKQIVDGVARPSTPEELPSFKPVITVTE